MDLQRNTIFLQREAVLKLDILLCKVKLCFPKKTKQKEQELDVPALYYCLDLEVVPTDGKVPFCAQPANLLLDILYIAHCSAISLCYSFGW